jgi:uncharacterized membrane protein
METQQEKQWRENPDNWIWGMFYFNREDKRLIPPKRHKWMGWTVNFASPKSILMMIAIIGAAVFVSYYFDLGHHPWK